MNKLLTKEEVLMKVADESNFVTYDDIVENVKEEIECAMDTYANQQAQVMSISFVEWIANRKDIVPRVEKEDVVWYFIHSGEVCCSNSSQLYSLFLTQYNK